MTDPKKTLIAALLDRTGSMATCQKATKEGFDELINGQRQEPGECLVTLAQFDRHGNEPIPEWVYRNKPIAEAPPLVLVPRGNTPLLDATAGFITQIGEDLNALPEDERPALVICTIMTDGHENSSREYSPAARGWERIAEMIRHQREAYNWQFMFIGANIDAVKVGADMGIPVAAAMTFNAIDDAAVMDSYSAVSANVSGLRSGVQLSANFTDDQRKRAMGRQEQTPSRR